MKTRLLLIALSALLTLSITGCCGSIEEELEGIANMESKPGMPELRAAGCISAVTIPIQGRVLCNIEPAKELTCEDAAKTYADAQAESPKEVELAIVDFDTTDNSKNKVRCEGVYGADGKFIRKVKSKTQVGTRRTTTTTMD